MVAVILWKGQAVEWRRESSVSSRSGVGKAPRVSGPGGAVFIVCTYRLNTISPGVPGCVRVCVCTHFGL